MFLRMIYTEKLEHLIAIVYKVTTFIVKGHSLPVVSAHQSHYT